MIVDERYATILLERRRPDVAHLHALALELHAGLVALADAQTTWERRWPWLQAAAVLGFVVKRLEGANR